MQLSQINELLQNLHSPDRTKLKFIKKEVTSDISPNSYGEYNQGEYGEYANIYQVVGEDNLYLKVNFQTDSYGSNETVQSVQFVKAKEVVISAFEKI